MEKRVIGFLALAALAPDCGAAEPIALSVRVQARSIAPGEPLRVVAVSDRPLESLEGELLGLRIGMVRDAEDGHRWSGWAMVGLDQLPGLAAIELNGTGVDGRPAPATYAIDIQAKEFPEEHLKVAPRYVEPPKEVLDRLAEERRRLAEIYRSRRAVALSLGPFIRPVPGRATSAFGTRRLFNGEPRSPHPGLDLSASTGTEVRASGPGSVVLARELYYSGNTVIVDHGGGLFTLYAHLSEILVEEHQEIGAGHRLGLSGATGRVTGPHLHWGAKIGDRPFDPEALLDESLFR